MKPFKKLLVRLSVDILFTDVRTPVLLLRELLQYRSCPNYLKQDYVVKYCIGSAVADFGVMPHIIRCHSPVLQNQFTCPRSVVNDRGRGRASGSFVMADISTTFLELLCPFMHIPSWQNSSSAWRTKPLVNIGTRYTFRPHKNESLNAALLSCKP